MTQIRPDNVLVTSLIDAYLNYGTKRGTISISGTLGSGVTVDYSATIAVDRPNSIADVYAKNLNTGDKMSLIAGNVHNPFVDVDGQARTSVTYANGVLAVTFSVSNLTGGSITLTSQVMEITVVLYQVPY